MPDTTTPTAAEVMGWNVHNPHRSPKGMGDVEAWKCQDCGEWIREYGSQERTQCPSPWNQHPKPTPDDMLAWLGGDMIDGVMVHAFDVVITRDHFGSVVFDVADAHGGDSPGRFTARTLHAALEAAVLAVGGAE